MAVIHGLNAVAPLKQVQTPLSWPTQAGVIHGLNAVAPLKPDALSHGAPAQYGYPRPKRRGPIEAEKIVTLCHPSAVLSTA